MKKLIVLVLVLCFFSILLYSCIINQTEVLVTPSRKPETTSSPVVSVLPVKSEVPVSQKPELSTQPPVNEINRYEDSIGNPTLLKSYEVNKDGRYLYLPSGDNCEVLLEIPFNFESRIGFEFASGPTGPQSFFVDGNEIYIGNTYKHNILKYIDGKYDSEFEFEENLYLLDFCVIDETYYILARTYDHETGKLNTKLNVITDFEETVKQIDIVNLTDNAEAYITPSKIFVYGNNLIIKFEHTGDFFILDLSEEDNWIKFIDDFITINTASDDIFSVKTYSGTLVLPVYGDLKNLSSYWLDEDKYYLINEYKYRDETTGTIVAEKVITVVGGNEVNARMLLFDKNPMITLNRRLFVTQDNQVYQMLFDEEYNLSIVKLKTEEQYISYLFK